MLSANVTLERPGLPRVALARAALLQAIDELGSLSAAAQQVGLSYKAAWDAVQGLNNLFDAPLVAASAGGKTGGSTQLTPDGRAALAAFRRVQAALDQASVGSVTGSSCRAASTTSRLSGEAKVWMNSYT